MYLALSVERTMSGMGLDGGDIKGRRYINETESR